MNSSAYHSDLWAKALNGDHNAYALLHKSIYPGLYHYIFQMVKDDDIVEDLLQDLFVKMWQKSSQIGTIQNVKAYFFTASRSIAINYFRQAKSKALKLENFIQPEFSFSCEDIIISTEENTALKGIMAHALNTLPARQREIIYLKYYEDMEYQKIAEVTGIQYQSVVNHVFRALQVLRAAFKHSKNESIIFF